MFTGLITALLIAESLAQVSQESSIAGTIVLDGDRMALLKIDGSDVTLRVGLWDAAGTTEIVAEVVPVELPGTGGQQHGFMLLVPTTVPAGNYYIRARVSADITLTSTQAVDDADIARVFHPFVISSPHS